jgi:hypothetical protein
MTKPGNKESKQNINDGADESSGKMKREVAQKALMVVALRNKFFFMLYRNALLVFLASLLCLFFTIVLTFVFAGKPVSPRYIAINEDGSYINLSPLSECKPDVEVQNFVMSATKRLFRYDHLNYGDQIQDAAYYFTVPDGWNAYLTSYRASKTLDAVKENRWIVTVNVNSIPQITKVGVVDGICTWDIKLPVNVMYMGNKAQSVSLNLYFRVKRQSVIQNPEGLGISNLVQEQTK